MKIIVDKMPNSPEECDYSNYMYGICYCNYSEALFNNQKVCTDVKDCKFFTSKENNNEVNQNE